MVNILHYLVRWVSKKGEETALLRQIGSEETALFYSKVVHILHHSSEETAPIWPLYRIQENTIKRIQGIVNGNIMNFVNCVKIVSMNNDVDWKEIFSAKVFYRVLVFLCFWLENRDF